MYAHECVCVHLCHIYDMQYIPDYTCFKRISSKYNVICMTFKYIYLEYSHTNMLNTSEGYGYSCLSSLSLIRSVYVHVFMYACMNATLCVRARAECMYMHRWRDENRLEHDPLIRINTYRDMYMHALMYEHARTVGTHFPSCYRCSREIGPDNWIQLSGPIFRLHL
jgi:hypothetical protein